jgi:uncharacterized protein (DUF608 family)
MESLSKIFTFKDKKQIKNCFKQYNNCLAKHMVLHRIAEEQFDLKQKVYNEIINQKKENKMRK